MSQEIKKKISELLTSLENLSKAKSFYIQALASAKEKADALSALSQDIINKPHIIIDDYEIDS